MVIIGIKEVKGPFFVNCGRRFEYILYKRRPRWMLRAKKVEEGKCEPRELHNLRKYKKFGDVTDHDVTDG